MWMPQSKRFEQAGTVSEMTTMQCSDSNALTSRKLSGCHNRRSAPSSQLEQGDAGSDLWRKTVTLVADGLVVNIRIRIYLIRISKPCRDNAHSTQGPRQSSTPRSAK
jgi:hypothetical protein